MSQIKNTTAREWLVILLIAAIGFIIGECLI